MLGVVEGRSHVTFLVRDLDRMERLLTDVLGARKVYDSGAGMFSLSKERFFLVGDVWIAVSANSTPSRGSPAPRRCGGPC
jgi:catechol 2,3-dioxygenase-like lactoylglutathione lyase family enzyme